MKTLKSMARAVVMKPEYSRTYLHALWLAMPCFKPIPESGEHKVKFHWTFASIKKMVTALTTRLTHTPNLVCKEISSSTDA